MIVRAIGNFDPLLIARSGQLFRWEELEGGAVRFTAGDRRVTVRPAGEGTFAFSCEEAAFETLWRGYFDLDADYAAIGGLRVEARQKLAEIRPLSIGQASRISGVSPADIAVLLIWLGQQEQ